VAELDQAIHQPTRLRLMMLLSGIEEADFNFLRTTLGLSNGNLSAHASRLEEAGYLEVSKAFEGKLPKTTYRLTPRGRDKLAEYWAALDEIRCSAPMTPRENA